jgi:hypothetical protein
VRGNETVQETQQDAYPLGLESPGRLIAWASGMCWQPECAMRSSASGVLVDEIRKSLEFISCALISAIDLNY